jgi:hypothetical protein
LMYFLKVKKWHYVIMVHVVIILEYYQNYLIVDVMV